jgi:nucleoside triphosphate diphosphatase
MSFADQRMQALIEIMAKLRDPEGGCPWDLEQDFSTIAPYTIEEAYEVAEAIRGGDRKQLRNELGDLLFQVVFHARMAEEEGAFSFVGVVDAIADKLTRRHPHVFGDAEVSGASDQSQRWEAMKRDERREDAGAVSQPASQLDGVPGVLPALMRAQKLGERAGSVGFDWPSAEPVLAKIHEEIGELARAGTRAERREELGDLLFAVVNLSRHLDVDAEAALTDANQKFERRFRSIEAALDQQDRAMEEASLEEMESLWERAKTQE